MSVEHRIDILVNNAGLLAKAPVVEAGMDHFRQVMETNFFGCLELIAAVTPQMMQRQSGGCCCDAAASSAAVARFCASCDYPSLMSTPRTTAWTITNISSAALPTHFVQYT
jgi:NADP-dependent 3-hydroxy acid dehydrogenase YdfG